MVFKRRRRVGRRKGGIRKKVNRLVKRMSSAVTHGRELISDSSFNNYITVFVGQPSTTRMNVVAASFVNTSLAAGTSVQERPGTQVYFDSIKVSVRIAPFTTSPTFQGANSWRIIVVLLKQVPDNGAGVHQHPTIAELLQTNLTTSASDLYAPIANEQSLAGRRATYQIVKDIRFGWTVSGGGNDNAMVIHRKFTIRPPKGMRTTYDGDTNNIDVCVLNHYVTYVMLDKALTTASNNPDIEFNQVANFHY